MMIMMGKLMNLVKNRFQNELNPDLELLNCVEFKTIFVSQIMLINTKLNGYT